MKNIAVISILTLLFASCKKESINGYSETFRLGENVVYTLNPSNGSMVTKILLAETDFVASIRGEIENEQEALGRDIYDFQVESVTCNRAYTTANETINSNDPLSNYLSSVNVFFDKNDGSDPIKIATAATVNVSMDILQSDLLELTGMYPDYIIYYTAVFDQLPNDIKGALIDVEFNVSTRFKFKEK
ncbi:MAG: hypothetical protein COA38_01715 [Fluviicola sp.]|nr:MAG: hypothetical protein COA38_01715 [Fluviicola sp.]